MAQSIWQHVRQFGIACLYETDDQFAKKVTMIAALVFVPEADVEDCFETLTSHSNWDNRIDPVSNYLEDNYILDTLAVDPTKRINQLIAGQGPPSQRRKYADLSARVLNVVQDYVNLPVWQYLGGIAYNYDF